MSSFPPGSPAFGYIRVSGDIQADRGLPVAGQRRAIEEYATANNLYLERVFVDEARPGSSDDRAQFQNMMTLAHQNPPACSAILLWSWSRFSRDQNDSHFWKASLRRHNVQIVDVSGETPVATGFEYVVESLIHWKDEQRLHEISNSSKRGQQTLAKLGYVPSGARPPRGFQVTFEDKELEGKRRRLRHWEPDPATWEAVQRAWQMRLAGKSYETIWRECGLYKSPECFCTFFGNRIYKGDLHMGDTIIPVPAVVTPEEWAAVNAGRGERRSGAYARRVNSTMLLSGIAVCGECGAALVGEHSSAAQRNDGYRRTPWYCYHCLKARKHECTLPRVGAQKLDALVIEDLLTHVLTDDNLALQWAEIARQGNQERPELEKREQQLVKQLHEVVVQLDRLIDAIEQAGITDRITERLQAREADKITLEHELASVRLKLAMPPPPDYAQVALLRELIQETFEAGSTSELRSVLRGILVRVTVCREEVRIEYKFPFCDRYMLSAPTGNVSIYRSVKR